MDKIEHYREIIKKVIYDYAQYKPANGQIDTEVIIDVEKDHYELMRIGWDGVRRVHGSVIHINIIGDKIWIQYDGTSYPVAEELEAMGIAKQAIVLGFLPPDERVYTEYAVN